MRRSLFGRKYFLNADLVNIQPIRTADQLMGSISCERTINILAQVWLIKLCHDVSFLWSTITAPWDTSIQPITPFAA